MDSLFSLRPRNLLLDSLPRRRGFTIFPATAKPPLEITSTAPWFHYPHCDRKTPPLESLPQRRGFITQDFPPRNRVCSISSGRDFPSLPFSTQSSRADRQACVFLDYAKFHSFPLNHTKGSLSTPLLALPGPNHSSRILHPPFPFLSFASHLSTSNAPRGKFRTKDVLHRQPRSGCCTGGCRIVLH